MTALACVLGGVLAAAASARAGAVSIDGEYESPLGLVRISGDGQAYRGIVAAPSRTCGFGARDEGSR
jgi:hypothetical protein